MLKLGLFCLLINVLKVHKNKVMRIYNNEEEVKIHLVLPWLESLGYRRECMEFEKTIKVNEGRKTKSIFADIVIYTDKKIKN